MKELWTKINFVPTAFELPQKETDESDKNDSAKNLGGDQEIIEAATFTRNIEHPMMTEKDKEKITAVRITNFPPDIKEEEVIKFLKEEVAEVITEENIVITRNDRSSQITLDQGSVDRGIMFKAADVLDYKATRLIRFPGRPLYVRYVRTLTPEKTKVQEEENKNGVKDLARQIDKKSQPRKNSATSSASAGISQVLKYKQTPNPKPTK